MSCYLPKHSVKIYANIFNKIANDKERKKWNKEKTTPEEYERAKSWIPYPSTLKKSDEESMKKEVLKLSTIMHIPLRLCVYNIKWLMIEVLHENINTLRFVIVLVIVNVTPFKVSPSNAHKSCQLINNSNVFRSLCLPFSLRFKRENWIYYPAYGS